MKHFPRWQSAVAMLLMLGAVVALSACGASVKTMSVSKAKAAGEFGTVVKAYKSGQFLLDGAVLSSLDLSSHFAYLKDQHELPKSVLLERSKDSSIHKEHLRYLAAMAWRYGFTAYYSDDGSLRRIVPSQANGLTKLRPSPNPTTGSKAPHVEAHDAAHNGTRRNPGGY